MSVNVSLYESADHAMRKKLKLNSDGDDSCSKKCRWGCGSADGAAVVPVLESSKVWGQAVCFVLVYQAGI
jgi:hypothetical protein